MKILVITPIYPNINNPTSGTFVHELNLLLKEKGHEVHTLHISDIGYRGWLKNDFKNINYSNKEGIKTYCINYRALMTQRLPRMNLRNFKKKMDYLINEYIKIEGTPDIIINQFSFLSGIAYNDLKNKYKIPNIIIEHHSLYLNENISPFIVNKLRETYESSEKFVVVSDILYENIQRMVSDPDKMVKIPNAISSNYVFSPPIDEKIFNFISVGNLILSKNHHKVIESFINTFNTDEKVQLTIVGRGPMFERLFKMIEESDRAHQIKIINGLHPKELVKKIITSNVFILASKYETFGIVYREATAVGRPIIASRTDGILEYWDPKLGVLLKSDSIIEIGNAMRQMTTSYEDYNFKDISDYTFKKYGPEQTVEKIDQLLGIIFSNKINGINNK